MVFPIKNIIHLFFLMLKLCASLLCWAALLLLLFIFFGFIVLSPILIAESAEDFEIEHIFVAIGFFLFLKASFHLLLVSLLNLSEKKSQGPFLSGESGFMKLCYAYTALVLCTTTISATTIFINFGFDTRTSITLCFVVFLLSLIYRLKLKSCILYIPMICVIFSSTLNNNIPMLNKYMKEIQTLTKDQGPNLIALKTSESSLPFGCTSLLIYDESNELSMPIDARSQEWKTRAINAKNCLVLLEEDSNPSFYIEPLEDCFYHVTVWTN